MATNAQMGAIKFSMSRLMGSVEAAGITQSVQAVTLPDGTTTLFETTKDDISEFVDWRHYCYVVCMRSV